MDSGLNRSLTTLLYIQQSISVSQTAISISDSTLLANKEATNLGWTKYPSSNAIQTYLPAIEGL